MASKNNQSSTILGTIASSTGTTEQAIILLSSLLFGYPLGLIHRYTLYGKKPQYQNLFFAISGFAIGYYNYGWEVLHSLLTVVGVYLILSFVGGTLLSAVLVFLFTMSYLLVGYYQTSTEEYDINWSTAQCILTLRLIGLAFDIYDGRKPPEMQSMDTKNTAINFTPSLLEVAAYTYFPASFLIGPQFPIKRYLEFIAGRHVTFADENGHRVLLKSVWPGFKQGALGILYLCIYQTSISYFPDNYMLTSEYDNQSFYRKCIFLGLWGKISLYKYISFWLITDGICILTGLAYNGTNDNDEDMWDGCASVKMVVYENATRFQDVILSFNISTNIWVSQHVYKRLKFLGNRHISQVVTMLFLSLWHGLHSGYYICFLLELPIMYAEKDIVDIFAKNSSAATFINKSAILRPIKWVLLKCVLLVLMGYALVPFVLLSYDRWFKVYKSLYFAGHIVSMSWPLYAPLIKMVLKPNEHQQNLVHRTDQISSDSRHTSIIKNQ